MRHAEPIAASCRPREEGRKRPRPDVIPGPLGRGRWAGSRHLGGAIRSSSGRASPCRATPNRTWTRPAPPRAAGQKTRRCVRMSHCEWLKTRFSRLVAAGEAAERGSGAWTGVPNPTSPRMARRNGPPFGPPRSLHAAAVAGTAKRIMLGRPRALWHGFESACGPERKKHRCRHQRGVGRGFGHASLPRRRP